MGRGFILGALWGLLVAIVTVSITSLIQGGARIRVTPPQASTVELPAGTPFDAPKPEGITVIPQTDSTISNEAAPTPLMDNNRDQQPGTNITTSTARPATGTVSTAGMTAPTIESDSLPPVTSQTIPPAAPPKIDTADAPQKTAPVPDSEPAKPANPTPAVVDAQTTVQTMPPVQAPAETADGSPVSPAPAKEAPLDANPIEAQTQAQTLPPSTDPATEEMALPVTAPPEAPNATPSPHAPKTDIATDTPIETRPAPAEKPVVDAETDAPAAIKSPVFDMGNLAPNIPTTRLPSIASTAQEDAQTPNAPTGALMLNSVPFDAPPDTPLMSIILIDDEANPVPDATLHEYPVPVAFAIDGSRQDASRAAARYRAAGFEVLMLTNFPVGATPSDIEQSFQAYETAIPEAIAIVDQDQNGFRRGRDVIKQITEILAQTGHGLVTMDKGLNTPQKIAVKNGIPAATIYRALDDKDESTTVIRRYLNRAAFQASQKGSVVLIGHTRFQTVEALLLWSSSDKSGTLALAPLSAILKAGKTP